MPATSATQSGAALQPHEYPRRVLLFVTGLTPQVVTETVYALAVDANGRTPFVPTEIRLITTAKGAEQARLALLARDRDQFGKLCRDYDLQGIRFDESMIEIIRDADGEPVADIMTAAQSEAAADTITRRIAELTADPQCAVHVSLAGGRKTLSFFAGYALSLYGREQDRLSHVLVSERFETHPEFFYKPPRPITLHDRDRLEMSTADARIRLALIPFVPMRGGFSSGLLNRSIGYAESVRLLARDPHQGEVRIRPQHLQVVWDGETIDLQPVAMAFYTWLADRRLREGDDGGFVAARQFLAKDDKYGLRADLLRTTRARFCERDPAGDKAWSTIARYLTGPAGTAAVSERKANRSWLDSVLNATRTSITEKLGARANEGLGIITRGAYGKGEYGLGCARGCIVIE
ncbi:MAG: TIGR02584 family CRISPR-associated protein [Proteobacteria bacterium]|nr:TIGR02584 family CRISPR-associated protein [Pseudomonadota bacterium]